MSQQHATYIMFAVWNLQDVFSVFTCPEKHCRVYMVSYNEMHLITFMSSMTSQKHQELFFFNQEPFYIDQSAMLAHKCFERHNHICGVVRPRYQYSILLFDTFISYFFTRHITLSGIMQLATYSFSDEISCIRQKAKLCIQCLIVSLNCNHMNEKNSQKQNRVQR